MTFKTVLLVVGVGQNEIEIDRATEIAAQLEAHLTVLALGIAPPPPSSPYGVVSNDIWAAEIRDGQTAARGAGERTRRRGSRPAARPRTCRRSSSTGRRSPPWSRATPATPTRR